MIHGPAAGNNRVSSCLPPPSLHQVPSQAPHGLPSAHLLPELPPSVSPEGYPPVYSCQLCLYSFTTYTALYSHHMAMHSISSQQLSQPMLCPHCLQVAPSPAELVFHIQSVHGGSDYKAKLLQSPTAKDSIKASSPVGSPESSDHSLGSPRSLA